jgi:hypothetical protein
MIAFLAVFIGFLVPSTFLTRIGVSIIVPLGLVGGVLGVIGVTRGICSRCPVCGRKALWAVPVKNILAVDCPDCGMIGGNPLRNLRPTLMTLQELE